MAAHMALQPGCLPSEVAEQEFWPPASFFVYMQGRLVVASHIWLEEAERFKSLMYRVGCPQVRKPVVCQCGYVCDSGGNEMGMQDDMPAL